MSCRSWKGLALRSYRAEVQERTQRQLQKLQGNEIIFLWAQCLQFPLWHRGNKCQEKKFHLPSKQCDFRKIKPYSQYRVTVFEKPRTAPCKNSHGLDLPPEFHYVFRCCFLFTHLFCSSLELISMPGKLREIVIVGPFYSLGKSKLTNSELPSTYTSSPFAKELHDATFNCSYS